PGTGVRRLRAGSRGPPGVHTAVPPRGAKRLLTRRSAASTLVTPTDGGRPLEDPLRTDDHRGFRSRTCEAGAHDAGGCVSSTRPGFRARWERLRRHGAFQGAIVFASASWLLLQAADIFGLPTSAVRALGVVLLVGFVASAVGAWIAVGRSAVAVAGERAAAPQATAPRRLRGRLVVAAAAVLLLAGFGAWWARPQLFGSVRPGAEVIAVLPFTTSGQS